MDPNLPVSDLRTLETVEARALAEPRLTTWLLGGFALLALTMAAIGIYGTISLLVNDRSQEIGIRIALGAQRASILKMVLSQGARLAAAGIGLGIIAALFLTRSLENLVYGVTTLDPLTFAVVPLVLSVVALMASFTPARRASRVDPVHILKR
jgi:putative ABC transport system permease protein